MRVHIHGDGAARALGVLLGSVGHQVSASEGPGILRVRSPEGWASTRIATGDAAGADLVLIDASSEEAEAEDASSDPLRVLRVRSGSSGDWLRPSVGPTDCLASFTVTTDGPADLAVDVPVVILRADAARMRKHLGGARSAGLVIRDSRDLPGQLGALLVKRLLDLPAALCSTTVAGLLADDEGRRIALAVLDEGMRVAERLGTGIGRLADTDPTELATQIRQRPRSLESARYVPGGAVPALLDALRRGADPKPYLAQRGLARKAGELGVAVDWNRRLVACLPRIARVGFYGSPLELLRAVA